MLLVIKLNNLLAMLNNIGGKSMARYIIVKSLSEENMKHNLYSQHFINYASNNVATISNQLISKVPVKPNPKMRDAAGDLVSVIPLEILIPAIIVFGILSDFFGDNNS
jgi:hypothetical protein